MFNRIKGLGKVKLEEDYLPSGGLTLVDIFKTPRQTILDRPPLNETVLVPVDDLKDNFLQPMSQDFHEDFQATVKQSDWSVVIRSFGGGDLGDQSNVSLTDAGDVKSSRMEIMAHFVEVLFDDLLATLKKASIKSIGAKGPVSRHFLNDSVNLIISERCR